MLKLSLQEVKGIRRGGRQKRRWEIDIREWVGLRVNSVLRKADSRGEQRELVVKSSVAPPQSIRLEDRLRQR